jgi:hypothetical protein
VRTKVRVCSRNKHRRRFVGTKFFLRLALAAKPNAVPDTAEEKYEFASFG